MGQRQGKRVPLLAMMLTVFLLPAASCGGAAEALGRLSRASDDVGRLVARGAEASELNGLSSKLDDIAKEVSNGASMTDRERAVIDHAAQNAAVLKEIAGMLGVADEVRGLISTEAVTLVHSSFLYGRQPTTPVFQAKMEEAGKAILKETTCSAFANEMNASSIVTPPSGLPPTVTATQPSANSVYADLRNVLSAAGLQISQVQQFVNLQGLSINTLSAAGKYVGSVKKIMSAAAWKNGGAFQAYFRVCVR